MAPRVDPVQSDPNLPARWSTKYGLTFPVTNDNSYQVWSIYNDSGYLPSHVMMDGSGKIFYRSAGYSYDPSPCTCVGGPSNTSMDCEIRCQIESKL